MNWTDGQTKRETEKKIDRQTHSRTDIQTEKER